jgi:hypothetical protein
MPAPSSNSKAPSRQGIIYLRVRSEREKVAMRYYRQLSLFRRVQVIAFAMLFGFEVGGYVLARGLGLTNNEVLGGLAIEMIGAVFTAIAVAYIDTGFDMAFKRKFGDETDMKLNILRDEIAALRRQQEVMADELIQHRDLVMVVEKIEHIAEIQARQAATQAYIARRVRKPNSSLR